jgi:hypothetical protein
MTSTKSIEKMPLKSNSYNNPKKSSIINPETNALKQDILFFKNDILKDLRRIEEKLNLKLTEQSIANNDQYEAFEKKLDILNSKIIRVNEFVSDNTNLSEKINTFQLFKSKTEDSILSLNSRIAIVQKETKDSLIKIEKILEENLKYPGIIGKNSKFSNFRFVIDYVMNNIKYLNDFKEEMINFDFAGFKKRINSDLQEFRFTLNENDRNLRKLIESNIKEFNSKVFDLDNKMENKFEDVYDTLKDYKNIINERISLYEEKVQNKFDNLQKNLEDKYKEHLNDINNFKNIKNKFTNDINNIKHNLSKMEKTVEFFKLLSEQNFMTTNSNKINYTTNNKIIFGENFDNNQIKNLILEKNKISDIPLNMKDFYNMNTNIQDNNMQNYEDKINTDNTLENITHDRNNNININEPYGSFDNSQNNDMLLKKIYYSDENNEIKLDELRNKKENTDLMQDEFNNDREKINNLFNLNLELKQSMKKMYLNKYKDFKKAIFQNNYSIMNIPNIKITKVVIPENVNDYKKVRISRSSLFDKKGKRVMSNNPSLSKKYFLQNADSLSVNRNSMTNVQNIKDVIKIKNPKNKRTKGGKYVESARILGHRRAPKHTENVDSLLLIQTKTKNNVLNSCDNIRKNKTRSWSFENNIKSKDERDEKIQIDFKKTFKDKNQFKELLLVNAKNLKKSRKIKM